MYEVLDCTAAHVILTLNSDDSIRQVAQRIYTPYETVRQAVNRLRARDTSSMRMASRSLRSPFETQHAS